MTAPFHLAFLVTDLSQAKEFYGNVLRCEEGRSTTNWVDFDFFGNQLSLHLDQEIIPPKDCGNVDGVFVPIPHFGVILSDDEFTSLANWLETSGIEFILQPQIRYQGEAGEQKAMFFKDPFGNAIEIKSFSKESEIFKKGR